MSVYLNACFGGLREVAPGRQIPFPRHRRRRRRRRRRCRACRHHRPSPARRLRFVLSPFAWRPFCERPSTGLREEETVCVPPSSPPPPSTGRPASCGSSAGDLLQQLGIYCSLERERAYIERSKPGKAHSSGSSIASAAAASAIERPQASLQQQCSGSDDRRVRDGGVGTPGFHGGGDDRVR